MGSGTDQNDSVVSSIIAKLKNVPDESSLSYIHKVPTIFRKGYEEYYTPRLVSLGPFHHGSESLRRMEIHKWRYLKDFLRRNPERNINSYVESLRGHTARALQFYGEPINLKSHEFIEMMLIDGCFILEFMFRSRNDRELPDDTDPLFTTAWMRSIIEQDMILLENQVPFFVMECLYTSPGPNGTACASFLELSFKFLDPYLLKDLVDFLRNPHHQVMHFVDLLRQCTIPTLPRASPKSDRVDRLIPSATVLHAAGIRFTRGESKSIMDISFSKHGVFNIPHFVILDSTELFYRNVMAFEHFDQYPSFITSYTSLMNQLIDTPDDVALLRRYGIMDHLLGDDEDVSDLFNRIGTGTQVNTGQFHYTKLMEDVNAYRDRRRNVWRAKLVSEYFNTPWSTISFIAALVLLICTKPWQMLYLNTVLYVTGFGAAGIRPCVSSFGADQFDETSKDYQSHLDRFFNFFYLSVTIGAIVAFTAVVYIQIKHGWGSAFGSLALAMGISNVLFFLGTPLYRHRLPGGSPLTRVAQVLVAAFKKRNKPFSSSEFVGLYEVPGKRSAIKGSGKIDHSDTFRCLDKAALQLKEDGVDPSPWRLCTVTQVEEVKILLRLLPIPACTIVLNMILTEYLTLSIQQAYTLNTHMGRLKLPVTCMPVFPGLSIFLILSLYYSVFVPLSRRITGHPHGASQLQRVGIGLVVSILSVGWAAIFERYRRMYAIKHGFEFNFLSSMPELSAYWLLIQYCLIGIAEVFCVVGLLEFLYQEAPDAMRSIGSAYAAIAGGLGCFAGSILNSIIKSITGNPHKGQESWLSQNINTGRFDYFYWLLTLLSVINFFVFLYAASRYKYRSKTQQGVQPVAPNGVSNPLGET